MAFKKLVNNIFKPVGVRKRHRTILGALGRIGFVSKGLVYAIIGGLTCATALRAYTPDDVSDDASPQSAFILLGGAEKIGSVLLCILAIGLGFYSTWRFWESITFQGYNKNFSKKKNFFKYRLSPLVSGLVYISYLVYIAKTLVYIRSVKNDNSQQINSSLNPSCIPNCLNKTTAGKIGTCFIGVGFLIAFITQVIPGVFGTFYKELKTHKYPKPLKYTINIIGHIGFLGRAGTFILVAIFMFKSVTIDQDTSKNTVGASLNQLKQNKSTRIIMFILGLFLVDFGLFAVLNVWCKYFPTRQYCDDTHNQHEKETVTQTSDNIESDASNQVHNAPPHNNRPKLREDHITINQ